jgi:hypothetical protein
MRDSINADADLGVWLSDFEQVIGGYTTIPVAAEAGNEVYLKYLR